MAKLRIYAQPLAGAFSSWDPFAPGLARLPLLEGGWGDFQPEAGLKGLTVENHAQQRLSANPSLALIPPGVAWQYGIDFYDENRLNTAFFPQATVAQMVEQLIRNQ